MSGLPTTRPEDAQSEQCFLGRGSLPEFKRLCFLLAYRGQRVYVVLGYRGHQHMSKPSDLVQGTLDMLLLKILALEPMNGFAVSQRLKQVSAATFCR